MKSYVTDDGKEEPFHPVTVKFTKPLVYDRISSQEVAEKVFLLQVCGHISSHQCVPSCHGHIFSMLPSVLVMSCYAPVLFPSGLVSRSEII